MKGVFVTGTGTGVGKTVVCGLLAGFLRGRGMRVAVQKWAETGVRAGGPSDIEAHRRFLGLPGPVPVEDLPDLCPYRFSFPASPHLAAVREGRRVDPDTIAAAYARLEARYDAVVVEGAGGFLVPLSEELRTGDLAARIGLPVLVVVANRLGCLNEALLAAEAIRGRGAVLLGMIFNRLPEAGEGTHPEILSDNPRIAAKMAGAPVLGELPALDDPFRGGEAFAPAGRALLERWRPA
ncbi:MAG: dethiobiotin synthase [Deltaproteobacteria bacterium]